MVGKVRITDEQREAEMALASAYGLDPTDVIGFTRHANGTMEFTLVGPARGAPFAGSPEIVTTVRYR